MLGEGWRNHTDSWDTPKLAFRLYTQSSLGVIPRTLKHFFGRFMGPSFVAWRDSSSCRSLTLRARSDLDCVSTSRLVSSGLNSGFGCLPRPLPRAAQQAPALHTSSA